MAGLVELMGTSTYLHCISFRKMGPQEVGYYKPLFAALAVPTMLTTEPGAGSGGKGGVDGTLSGNGAPYIGRLRLDGCFDESSVSDGLRQLGEALRTNDRLDALILG